MILYNVTVNIDKEIHEEWLQWMKVKHIPDVMKTGCFVENKILRLLGGEGEDPTYAMQYFAPSMADFERYQTEFAPALQAEHKAKYQDKARAFRTLLEVIQ